MSASVSRTEYHHPAQAFVVATKGPMKKTQTEEKADDTTSKLAMVALVFFTLFIVVKIGLHNIILAPFVALFAVISACFCKATSNGNHDIPGSGHATPSAPPSAPPSTSFWPSWTSSVPARPADAGFGGAAGVGGFASPAPNRRRTEGFPTPYTPGAAGAAAHDMPGSAVGRKS